MSRHGAVRHGRRRRLPRLRLRRGRPSRSEYLRCVFDEVHARRAVESLGRKAAKLVIKAARNSTCGYPTKVRCCVMIHEKSTGMCRIMDELRCDDTLLGGDVEDRDSGSCFPNPCALD